MTKKTNEMIFLIDNFKRNEKGIVETITPRFDISKNFLNEAIIVHPNKSTTFSGFRVMNITSMTELAVFVNKKTRKILAVGVSLN